MLRHRVRDGSKKEDTSHSVAEGLKPISKSYRSSGTWFIASITVFFFVLYVIVPVLFYISPTVRRHAVFLHYVSLSRNKNLSLPSDVGLNCTRNFYILSDDNIRLGSWHIPPADMLPNCEKNGLKEGEAFSDDLPVFLYLHGNAGTRGGAHRVELYRVLSEKVNSHIVAFDYRGYGDSTNVLPSDKGVVSDALHVYNWLTQRVSPKRILIWGHSLGTGVATALLEILSSTNRLPMGLVLEAPFTKLIDVVKHHPLSIFHRYMPFFDFFFAEPIGKEASAFDSITRIGQIKTPVLILHAEDDGFVPFYQGKQLYERALAECSQDLYPTQFVAFEANLNYGHKNIYKDPSLPNVIKQFMNSFTILSTKT